MNPERGVDLETQIDVFEEEAHDDYSEPHNRFAELNVLDNINIEYLKCQNILTE